MTTCANLQTNYNNLQSQFTLLQRQNQSMNQITDLLNNASQSLLCGPECQKQKISAELYQKMLDAQTKIQTAPIELENTKKTYYVYTQGEPYYDNMLEEELRQKAQQIGDLLTETFNQEVKDAELMNEYYNLAVINSQNTKALLEEFMEKNIELKSQLRDSHGDILTNDRKTYYEKDALNGLSNWYKFWWYIYYMLIIVLLLGIILGKSELSMIKKIIIFILLLFYPYYINIVTKWINNTYNSITEMIPKNAYNNL